MCTLPVTLILKASFALEQPHSQVGCSLSMCGSALLDIAQSPFHTHWHRERHKTWEQFIFCTTGLFPPGPSPPDPLPITFRVESQWGVTMAQTRPALELKFTVKFRLELAQTRNHHQCSRPVYLPAGTWKTWWRQTSGTGENHKILLSWTAMISANHITILCSDAIGTLSYTVGLLWEIFHIGPKFHFHLFCSFHVLPCLC